ncbi:hypothetical protein GOBAR_AA17843 [Gossypium barbadense]|uniref:Fanconi-associated nuclease n=1 Tax=Gossypium barbadense TaxID=3634 RepID=A0A2P5XHR0_GOSBA|nr:hypothetical protein GOBAR_AA17843 [Gossypium barbadense]
MLTGRESLSRLIGKRRRFLPNLQSILSSPIRSSLNLLSDKNGGLTETESSKGKVEISSSDLVTCPVCGSKVRGEDYTINSHLDRCLSRRTKRKLTQRTLLELNFGCSQSKLQISSDESERLLSSDLRKNCSDYEENVTRCFSKIDPREEKSHDQCRQLPHTESVKQIDVAGSAENPISDGRANTMVYFSALSTDNEESRNHMDGTVDSISGMAIDTFIVSRKFSDEKEVNLGANISLLRDPDNIKDSNAIKVLSASSACCKVLGYLPLELAQYLSPLIEKYCLSFEGYVISVPKRSLDAVPIQIVCQNIIFNGPWFRLSTIMYPEICNPQQAVKELSATGYLYLFEDTTKLHDDEMKDLLSLLTVSELRDILCTLRKKCNHGSRKQNLIASLLSCYKGGSCPVLQRLIWERTEICIRASPEAESLFWRAETLFFLNGEQDQSAFLLVDLRIVAIEVAQVIDQSLDENNFELVLRCIMIADSRISCCPEKLIDSTSPDLMAIFRSCFSASWVYSKVILLGISFLECERRYKDAIHLLRRLLDCFTCDARRGYWTVRLSVDLEHIGCPNESLSVAEAGLLDPWVRAGSRMALQRRVLRLAKPPRRWKTPSFSESLKRKIIEVHIQGRPLNCEAGRKSRFYGEDGEQCGVEQLALQYYATEGGWQGVHTESGIWMTIFGLLMWDILFSDVPNVFRTRFQTAPLDMDTDHFYLARKSLIEPQLQKIHDGLAEEILITSWELHMGTACRGVNWDQHSLSDLRAAVSCIRGPCLASLCRHLAQDYRSWLSGMPDLLLWRFHGDYKGEAKLVEVKGPRDQLSEQQRAWLLLLMDCGFNAEVCKVSPTVASP